MELLTHLNDYYDFPSIFQLFYKVDFVLLYKIKFYTHKNY